MFVVIVCFAAAAVSMAAYAHQGARFLEKTKQAVAERNETVMRAIK
jgi:hypothetical protein